MLLGKIVREIVESLTDHRDPVAGRILENLVSEELLLAHQRDVAKPAAELSRMSATRSSSVRLTT